jgi:hypothetical protein
MNSEKIKDYLIFFPKERVILFPIHEYFPIIANTIIKDYDEWGLLENKIITQREKYFNFFLEKKLDKILESFILLFRDLNIKIYTVYNKNYKIVPIHKKYIENIDNLYNNLIKKLRKKTKYIKKIEESCNFNNFEGHFRGIKIGIPSGENIEFLLNLQSFR